MQGSVVPLIAHLSTAVDLTVTDCELIKAVIGRAARAIPAHFDIVKESDRPHGVKIVLEGWAMRYKLLPDGRRQILSFLLPGDICDIHPFTLDRMDFSMASLTPLLCADIGQAQFEELLAGSARIAEAFAWGELVTASIQREWTANIGQRNALERVAHLLCETVARMSARGLGGPHHWPFPLTQGEIADASALTPVHVNRTLQQMRKDGLIELRARQLFLTDPARLREIAMFNPAYLHVRKLPMPA